MSSSPQSTDPVSHTPGPWHWDSDPMKGDQFNRVRYRVTTTGKTITQCYYSSADAHAKADTRLIAAAPDLLALAKQYANECALCGGTARDPWNGPNGKPCEDCADIRAVIAKAEGR